MGALWFIDDDCRLASENLYGLVFTTTVLYRQREENSPRFFFINYKIRKHILIYYNYIIISHAYTKIFIVRMCFALMYYVDIRIIRRGKIFIYFVYTQWALSNDDPITSWGHGSRKRAICHIIAFSVFVMGYKWQNIQYNGNKE